MLLTISALDTTITILLLILSYLLGSIPFALVIGKGIFKVDVREYGSKNIGTTNTTRVLGKKVGYTVFALDVFKGMAVMLLVILLNRCNIWHNPIELFCYGGMAVIGHCYSIFIDFKGGKAVATSLGVIAVLTPLPAIACLIIWLISFLISGYVSLSSSLATLTVLIGVWLLYFFGIDATTPLENFINQPSLLMAILYTCLASLIFIKHIPNYKRLIKGTERSFKKKKSQ